MKRIGVALLAAALVAGVITGLGATASSADTVPTIALSTLNGATVPQRFILDVDAPGVTGKVKFYDTTGGTLWLGNDMAAPYTWPYNMGEGTRSIEVRFDADGSRIDATFTVSGSTAPPTPAPPDGDTVNVSNATELAAALANAQPGQTINLADGEYLNEGGGRWSLTQSNVTLQGGRGAILESDAPSGDYGLWITGSHDTIHGITVRNATKGIVLDGSVGTVIDDVEVYNIGDEAVHFRACSSDGVLENSYVHDTGVRSPQYGEGVYVGSASSNWSKYNCTDGRDNSENVLVTGNTFQHIAAEGADLKEGTDSGTLVGNTFVDTGYSGQNSADSAIDVKGNGWLVKDNTISDPEGADLDGIQIHSVYSGYGQHNTVSGNQIEGVWPGFGIAGYPIADNMVTCDNSAPNAALGLVGSNTHPIACS